jgi:hypothetical protein
VRVTLNGVTLSLRLTRMGGEYLVGLSRAAREEAGVQIRSSCDVEIILDESRLR